MIKLFIALSIFSEILYLGIYKDLYKYQDSQDEEEKKTLLSKNGVTFFLFFITGMIYFCTTLYGVAHQQIPAVILLAMVIFETILPREIKRNTTYRKYIFVISTILLSVWLFI